MNIKIETEVMGEYRDVFNRFDKDLFLALSPPLVQVELTRFDGCIKGDKVQMYLKILGVKQEWHSLITNNNENAEEIFFVDEGVKLPPPLKFWEHKHIIRKSGASNSVIIDHIKFSTGVRVLDFLLYPILYLQFWYRKPIYKRYFK